MMKILVWNCRGAASKGVAAVIRDMKRRHKPELVVILEPRISGGQATKVIKSWGFNFSKRVEAEGFSGGIWLLWEVEGLTVDILRWEDQFIHCKVRLGSDTMFFTAVYASPSEQKRGRIWSGLQNIANEMVEPWMIAGDFNEIKSPLEKKGGGRVNETRCARFNDWIQSCNLIDIESSGPFFTWKGPKWEGLDRVYKRLDRCLCNAQWQGRFHNAEVRVIPRISSDHHPLLINLCTEVRGSMVRNFRFEAMWLMHDSFEALVQNHWKGGEDAHVKLSLFQQDLIRWNKEVFGRVEARKRRLGGGKCRGVKFWSDVWLDDGKTLIGKSVRPLENEEESLMVSDLAHTDGQWDIARIEKLLPQAGGPDN
ncbi:hypothetical protein K1719_011800 [Acacia pycnantha]|nr:hypothetical protein K1719_011800 [Acacia pycnantha]